MHQPNIYREREACPLYTAIGVISGRWKPMILQRLARRPHGFGELQRSMPRITRKVLTEQLRQLQADGLVARRAMTPARLGVRYAQTPYARTLNPVFAALLEWGVQHLRRRDAAAGTRIMPPRGDS
ncbi:MAG TPA: helix-turn-helix domain-containing protein [Vicinamibacterales bacterium]|nr:helix-turn-helix domain-containing protein [Vicinamibacterales bacterium]